jgi:hypothetical protein
MSLNERACAGHLSPAQLFHAQNMAFHKKLLYFALGTRAEANYLLYHCTTNVQDIMKCTSAAAAAAAAATGGEKEKGRNRFPR